MAKRVTFSPIRLSVVDDYPNVGVVARTRMTVDLGSPSQPFMLEYPLTSPGVWDIDDDELVPDAPIPKGHWVLTDYGKDERGLLREVIAAIEGR